MRTIEIVVYNVNELKEKFPQGYTCAYEKYQQTVSKLLTTIKQVYNI